MSTYLEVVRPKLLLLLTQAKAVAEPDEEVVRSLTDIEKVLQKLKGMDLAVNKKAKAADSTNQNLHNMEMEDTSKRPNKLLGQTLLYQVSCLERQIYNLSNNSTIETIKKALVTIEPIAKTIDHIISRLQQMQMQENQLGTTQEMSQEPSTLLMESVFDKESDVIATIRRSYEDLDGTELKVCLLSLSIFPEKTAIKKRPLIYWWIGEGFITSTKEKRAEEIGEEIFEKLMRKDLIQPGSGEPNCELLIKSCTMHPWIRRMLISLASEAKLFEFDPKWPMMPSYSILTCRRACLVSNNDKPIPEGAGVDALLTLFNVNVQYLDLEQKRLEELKKVEVLQLGRWQNSPTHHIEVEHRRFVAASSAEGILNGLGAQKYLKYLSLRGISRITQLPDSILNLISLEILDLRACHDLERLPSDISSLKKLTHLDVSECFLLEGMPKGLQKLASLQVLKGFLIGTQKKTPCRLGDLAKLKNLRRLSIHMGNEAFVHPGEFKMLEGVSSLRHLKISWGVLSSNFKEKIDKESEKLSFPPNLEKLDLQGFPIPKIPDGLRPSKLKKLKKLYIMGGELNSLSHEEVPHGEVRHGEAHEQWKVEILCLHFLKKMESPRLFVSGKVDLESLERLFPCMRYSAVTEYKG